MNFVYLFIPIILVLNLDKVFTFDHVFAEETKQEEVFEQCVQQLVEGTFEGYNATILAYGQVCNSFC